MKNQTSFKNNFKLLNELKDTAKPNCTHMTLIKSNSSASNYVWIKNKKKERKICPNESFVYLESRISMELSFYLLWLLLFVDLLRSFIRVSIKIYFGMIFFFDGIL